MSFLDLLGITAFLKRGEQLDRIEQKVNYLMAQVQIDQSVLDALASQLDEIGNAVQAIVDDPGNPLQEADVSGIVKSVDKLKEIVSKPSEPVDPNDLPHPDQSLPGDQPQVNPLKQ